ncbi:hypothetical protein AB0J25_24115 [Streptomyces sp. NPDC049910]|uniref:hypothetical protein n=1 Tax=Streptomyces sp. NPDC049910 TaxID=3155278 RepID=UPI003449C1FC
MGALEESKVIHNLCNLEVRVNTTGLKGGDTGYGGRTEVTLLNLGSTAMAGRVDGQFPDRAEQITIEVTGDAELFALAEALEWAAQRLRVAIG